MIRIKQDIIDPPTQNQHNHRTGSGVSFILLEFKLQTDCIFEQYTWIHYVANQVEASSRGSQGINLDFSIPRSVQNPATTILETVKYSFFESMSAKKSYFHITSTETGELSVKTAN